MFGNLTTVLPDEFAINSNRFGFLHMFQCLKSSHMC